MGVIPNPLPANQVGRLSTTTQQLQARGSFAPALVAAATATAAVSLLDQPLVASMRPTDNDPTQKYHAEQSPLLITKTSTPYGDDDYDDNAISNSPSTNATTTSTDDISLTASMTGTSSLMSVSVNLAKTAAGTGILALPYACREGGLILFVVGTLFISMWNVFGVARLCSCLDILAKSKGLYRDVAPAPPGTETLGKLAYYATGGEWGLTVLDVMLLVLLCGIVIAYENAIRAFSPYTTGSVVWDATILAVILTPLCMTDDLSNLSRLSHMGLIILGAAILVIAGYGINGYDASNYEDSHVFTLLPRNGLAGASHWFGCVVFGFGITPLTFNFRESMAQPEQLPRAAMISMLLVAVAYIVTGIALLYLYPDIHTDVLSQIPEGGWLATATRLAMIVVVLATAPLLVVPCALILEGKVHNHDSEIHPRTRFWTRTSLCFVTVALSAMVPEFVTVLSFVGCFSVAIVSFCVPPFLHWVLLAHKQKGEASQPGLGTSQSHGDRHWRGLFSPSLALDCVALLCGTITAVVTTLFTFRKTMEEK